MMTDLLLSNLLAGPDLDIEDGDFAVGPADEQHKYLLMATNKGDWRQRPDAGAGLEAQVNADDTDSVLAELERQFQADGLRVNQLTLEGDNLFIDAAYDN